MHKNNCKKGTIRPEHLLLNDTSDTTAPQTSTYEQLFGYSNQLAQPNDKVIYMEDDSNPISAHPDPGIEENDEPEPHPTTPPDEHEEQPPAPSSPTSHPPTGARRKPGRPPKSDVPQSDRDKASTLLDTANLTKKHLPDHTNVLRSY